MKKTALPNPSNRNAVIYARYSSHSQRDVSIDQQVRADREFAAREGLTVTAVYADRALTGTSDQRPEFQRMIEDAKTGAFAYVIVYSLDRFARDRYDSVIYKRQLRENGVRVLSAMERISDDPSGVLLESMLEGLAEYYSRELSTKIRRGLLDNAQKCMVACALPFGYRKGPDGKFAIEPAEADIIREIFRRVLAHETLADICRDLNDRGIRTKHGALWNKSSFNKLLSNERYVGTYVYGDIRIENGIPAIVDRTTFYAVQDELKHRGNPRGGKRRGKTVYYLTGKVFCAMCKSPMIGNSGTSKSGELHTYYACKRQLHDKTCGKKRVPQAKLEYFVADAAKRFVLDEEVIGELVDNAIRHQEEMAAGQDQETALLKKELQQVESALANILRAIEQGMFSETMKARMDELEERKNALQAQIASRDHRVEANQLTREEFLAAFTLLREGEIDNTVFQELLFDMILHSVYVGEDRVTIVFSYAKNGHDTVELPFDLAAIPDVACSFKVDWWASGDSKRTPVITVIGDYVILDLPYPMVA